ncbi:MAG: MFS transporter [Nitrospinota bacterium]
MGRGPKGLWYGWVVLAIAFLTMVLAVGIRDAFAVFFVAILKEFGWSRQLTAGAFSAGILVQALLSPLAGWLTDRVGPRRLMPAGAFVMAASLVAASQMSSPWHLYAVYIFMSIGFVHFTYIPFTAVLPNWFVRRRGLAFGVMMSSIGFRSVVAVPVQAAIDALGWRLAYVLSAGVIAGVVLPLTALYVRGRPEEVGSVSDEALLPPSSRRGHLIVDRAWADRCFTLGSALATGRVWSLWAMFFLLGVSYRLLAAHQVANLVDLGFGELLAAAYIALWGLAVVGGNALSFLSDRWGREGTYGLGVALSLIGTAFLVSLSGPEARFILFSYLLTLGVGLGIVRPAAQAALADIFEGRNFGSISGAILSSFGAGGAVGPWLGGYIFDRWGNYYWAFLAVGLSLVGSLGTLLLSSPGKVRSVR